ncbi:DNA starvation/stationary phase protection protein [Burkholderia sp. Ac-20365]|uniref:Dps family protein n=1 Tax=Burkholderia sp. Ac-20365 TaxID=2703897 RepID=UPI00197B5086|nr:DNA starvation/stationary phase protection protein [Burkholderia sp. Ac-20365]MBN3767878.1 DNA starvation/stationary phase protection protein [Burkholderia sp. Ac-20365]
MSTIHASVALTHAVQFKPFSERAIDDIASHLNPLLADVFALYLKTQNCRLHMFGSSSGDDHQLLDEQGEQIFSITDAIAERVRMIGGETLHSIADIARLQRLADNDLPAAPLHTMLAGLRADNLRLAAFMLSAHATCEKHQDVGTASLLENWIDDAQRRARCLLDAARG